ncbi:MAG TPA: hypothetical protein VFV96_18435 [Verrucomicrobiae bacterium]|nr:hypothetical protein [Verrucomicrobiae bacterium]
MKPASSHPRLISRLLLLCGLGVSPMAMGGVTVITHGLNGTTTGWVTGMANAIASHASGKAANAPIYKLTVSNTAGTLTTSASKVSGGDPRTIATGEIIVLIDWGAVADGNSFNTAQVAAAVAPDFTTTNFIPELGGHALVEWPLHFIGHSRGGSLVCELSRLLGTQGIWVDHVTTLDAHPLNNDGFNDFIYSAHDATARIYENVLFADSCYQNASLLINGEPVPGASWRKQSTFSGGYTDTLSGNHSDVHLWYHGTIDWNIPTSDTEASLTGSERQTWWTAAESMGTNSGFCYSLLGGSNRLSLLQPNGANSSPVRDGFNQKYDLGAGMANNRTDLSTNSGEWPNVIRLDLTTPNPIASGGIATLQIYYQWAVPVSETQTVQVYLDDDANPRNGNERLALTGTASGTTDSQVGSGTIAVPLDPFSVPAGAYAVFVKVTGAGQSRILYAPEFLRVVPDMTPPTLDLAAGTQGTLTLGVNGAAGQTVVIEDSVDLREWQAFWTNQLPTTRWEMPFGPAGSNQFFRARLLP